MARLTAGQQQSLTSPSPSLVHRVQHKQTLRNILSLNKLTAHARDDHRDDHVTDSLSLPAVSHVTCVNMAAIDGPARVPGCQICYNPDVLLQPYRPSAPAVVSVCPGQPLLPAVVQRTGGFVDRAEKFFVSPGSQLIVGTQFRK